VPTWLLALIAGSVLTWLSAYAARVTMVKREVEANDRALGVIDDHLQTWVEDDTVRLRRELRGITEAANKKNLLRSGEHGQRIAQAKERALQAYRDQERTARSQEAEIGSRESQRHSLYRAWKKRPFGLTAPERVKPIIDEWAAPVTRHFADPEQEGAQLEIDDPRNRTIESTLTHLADDPKALT
jgi:hypothetical protein